MKILIVGAGPAGLYLAYLIARRRPEWRLRIVEQNPADATFGFGVVFSDRALAFLREADPETHELILPAMEAWTDIALAHPAQSIRIDGIGFAAIGRLALLQFLQRRLAGVGPRPQYERALTSRAELADHDLVVGADGVNSFVRGGAGGSFGTRVSQGRNKFVWYGTTRRYEVLTQTFVEAEHGAFAGHHYRYSPSMSTFIVECDPATWARASFASMDEGATRTYCERVFAEALAGHPLVSNRSIWRCFPTIWNERWAVGNTVLVGDALRTAHFSIGSGTRLAMEDAIALAAALEDHRTDVRAALAAFEERRRPVVEKLVAAANASAAWYEHFPERLRLPPWAFAWSYMQRSGRVDAEKLRQVAPGFVAAYDAWRSSA